MYEEVIPLATRIFIVFNAIGNVPVLLGMLRSFTAAKQRRIILREMSIALFLMLVFAYFGKQVLSSLSLDLFSLRIAGGTILFLIGLTMLFPVKEDPKALQTEPFIVPLAIPLLTGPGTISTLMIFADMYRSDGLMLAVIATAWIPSLVILLLASYIKRLLGEPVLYALERLAGLILAFMAVQMITTGIKDYAHMVLNILG